MRTLFLLGGFGLLAVCLGLVFLSGRVPGVAG
jgi:hypothetical protein